MIDEKEVSKKILGWYEDLKKERLPWEDEWYEIAKFLDPRRENLFNINYETNVKTGKHIFDGTAISAHRLLVDGLMGYLVSPSLNWFRTRMADRKLEKLPGVKEWLEEVDKHFYSIFRRSNFYVQMPSFLAIGTSTGTATMYFGENPKKKVIYFDVLHPLEAYIGTDEYDNVNTLFRVFKMKARNILEKFKEDELDKDLIKKLEKTPEEKYEILHAVFPRKQRIVGKLDRKNKPYASFYILLDKGQILRESGFDTFPYVVWWWEKNKYEPYGRSPAFDALADIKALNQISRTLLKAANRAVDPPYNAPASLKGRISLKPNAFNYYENPEEIIRPIETTINYPIGADREQKKQEAIKQHFKVEFFLMLANATRRMTATEIVERQGEKAALMEAPIARLSADVLNPIFDRIFEIELRRGRLPEIPQSLKDYEGAEMEIDYTGPLAQAQKRLFRTQGIDRSLERVLPIAQEKPDVIDNIDWDELVREIMDADGMPQKIIVPPEKVNKIRALRAQAQVQQAKMEQAQQVAEMMPKLAQAQQAGGENV